MKHLKTLLIIFAACFLSCSENSTFEESLNKIEFRADKVTICHINGQGEFHPIKVNSNAIPAHLAHGDYLSDDEGYCVTCTHCDINTITQYEWESYFDADELTCTIYTGATIWTDRTRPDGNARGVSAIEFPSTGQKMVLSWLPGGSYCQRIVDVDITEEEWEECLAFIRKLISTRPDLPELCDILEEQPNFKNLIIPKEPLKKHSFTVLDE